MPHQSATSTECNSNISFPSITLISVQFQDTKINIRISVVFLRTDSKLSEIEVKKTILQ